MNTTFGHIHFWITFARLFDLLAMYYEGLAGMPRRYLDYSNWISFNQSAVSPDDLHDGDGRIRDPAAVHLYSLSISRETGNDPNPWQANTLEWTTPIRPGHGNWPGDIPRITVAV